MENLIREILDRGDGLTPSIEVGLAPIVVSDEDREGNDEADNADGEENDGDIHGRSPLQTEAQCRDMSHDNDQRSKYCNTSNPFENGHAQKHNHLRVTGIPLFLQMSLVDHLQDEDDAEDSIDGDNDHATIVEKRINPSVERHSIFSFYR